MKRTCACAAWMGMALACGASESSGGLRGAEPTDPRAASSEIDLSALAGDGEEQPAEEAAIHEEEATSAAE